MLDKAKVACKLLLVKNLHDAGFFKAMEECVIEEDSILEMELAHD